MGGIIVPSHLRFPAIDEKDFLSGTRVMTALDKVGSHYLRTEFRRHARRVLEEFVNCILSTVASRSVIGQAMSCFCPAIVVGWDDVAPSQLLNKLLDGLLENGWIRGSEAGPRTSPLCRSSGSWSGRPRGAALKSVTSCQSVLHRLVLVLISTCIKYVSYPIMHVVLTFMRFVLRKRLWCFKCSS